MKTYTIVRNCCTSGNCCTCMGVSALGTPLRVVHAYDLREDIARKMLEGWKRYAPIMRETTNDDRPRAEAFKRADVINNK